MDISRANTEPYYRLLRFHESINRIMKFGAASLLLLRRETVDSGNTDLLVDLVRQTGEPWKAPSNWRDPTAVLNDVDQALSEFGIVRVFSALDEFKSGIESEFFRWHAVVNGNPDYSPPADLDEEFQDSDRISKLIFWIGHDPSLISDFQPVLRYFELARDCIVHRLGSASSAFAEHLASKELKTSIEQWQSKIEEKELPNLPSTPVNSIIKLKPRHVIMASDVCFKAATIVNQLMVDELGITGMVFMAAHHGLLKDDPTRTDAYRTPQEVIHRILSDRLRVSELSPSETISTLKGIGVWKQCIDRHDAQWQPAK